MENIELLKFATFVTSFGSFALPLATLIFNIVAMVINFNGASFTSADMVFWLVIPGAAMIFNFPLSSFGMSTTTQKNTELVEKLLFNPINQIVIILAQPIQLILTVGGIAYVAYRFI